MIVSLEPELVERLSRLDTAATTAVEDLNADLAAAVRRTAVMRRLFYAAVLAVALYGTATGAVARFGLPWPVAIGGIFALELGGVVFLSNAETRRRLGEHAALSRLLGAAVAAAAATFNLLTHASLLFGGFFALMSVLGFVAWWLDVENKRRDRLRARGLLAAATPAYEMWSHWLRHPLITNRARGFAKAYPQLGLYGSLEAAVITMRREKRNTALAEALRARIRAAVGRDLADIAVLTFDMDEVASRLRSGADYDGLTALLGSELTAERVLHGRDDPTAAAARAWLAQHRGELPPLPGPRSDEDRAGPVHRGLPSAPLRSDPDQTRDIAASGPSGLAQAAAAEAYVDGDRHAPRNGAPVSVPAIHLARHATTVRLDHREEADHSAAPAGPTAVGGEPVDADTVKVRVLGTPALLDAGGTPVRGLRTKSVELLAYLALHPDGAAQPDIVAAVWPEVPPERAAQRLSTCLANLRSAIRQIREAQDHDADGGTRAEPIINTAGTYRLDVAIVTADWWPTVNGASHASAADNEHHTGEWPDALDETLDSLAEHTDYPWIDAVREQAGRQVESINHRQDR